MLNLVNGMNGYVHVEDRSQKREAKTFWEHTFNIPKDVGNRNLLEQANKNRFGRRQVCLDSVLKNPCECAGCDWNIMMNTANEVLSIMVYPRPSTAHEINLPSGYLMSYKVVVRVLNQRTKGDDFSESWVNEWDQREHKLRQRPHQIFNLSTVRSQNSEFVYNDLNLSTTAFQLHLTLSVTFSYDNLVQPRMPGIQGACLHQLEQEVARLELELKKEKGKLSQLQARMRDAASAREQVLIQERDALIEKNKKIAESNERVVEYIHQLFPKEMQDMQTKLWETTNKCMSTFTDSMHRVQSLVESLEKQKSWQNNSNPYPTIKEQPRHELNDIKTIVDAALLPVVQILANWNTKSPVVSIPNRPQELKVSAYSQEPTAAFPKPSSGDYRTPQLSSQPQTPKSPPRNLVIYPMLSAKTTNTSEHLAENPFSTNLSSAPQNSNESLFGSVSPIKEDKSAARGIFGIGTSSKETSSKQTNIFEMQTTHTPSGGIFGNETDRFGKTEVPAPVSSFITNIEANTNPPFGANTGKGLGAELFSSGSGLFGDWEALSSTNVPQFKFTTAGTGSCEELQLGVGMEDKKTDTGIFGNTYGNIFGKGFKKTDTNPDEPVNITFKPMYQDLEKKEVDTGHKDEKVLFSERCKVFRNLEGTFTERGKGNMEIYQDTKKNTVRLVLRQEITLKIRLNQAISTMQGLTQVNPKRLRWVNVDFGNPDYNPEEGKALVFLAGFKNAPIAKRFFDLCSSFLKGTSTELSIPGLQQSPVEKKTSESSTSLFAKKPVEPTTSLFGIKTQESPKPLFSGADINSFGTGLSSGSKSNDHDKTPTNHEPSNITFKPMYEGLEKKIVDTGHSNETILFSERSKVFRNLEGSFTERGKGNLEIYQNNDTKSTRLILRQEVTLKIRVHQVMASMNGLTKVKEKRVRWINCDFGNTDSNMAEGEALIFLAGFKTAEITSRFFDLCKSLSKESNEKIEEPNLSDSKKDKEIVKSEEQGEDREKTPLVESTEDVENILGTPPVKSLSPEPQKSCSKTLDFDEKPTEGEAQNGEVECNLFGDKTPKDTLNIDKTEQSDNKPEVDSSSHKFSEYPAFEPGSAFGAGSTFGSGGAFGAAGIGNKDSMFSSGIFGTEQSNFAEVNPLTGKSENQLGIAPNEEDDEDDPEKFHMHDQTALFKGQASTGHETETLIKSVGPAKLYRFDDNQWKARGQGKFQFWQTPEGMIRMVMREDRTGHLRLNHYVDPQLPLDLKDGAGNVFMWVADDYCPDDGGMTAPVSESRSFSAKFRQSDTDSIAAFKENYEAGQQKNMTYAQTQE